MDPVPDFKYEKELEDGLHRYLDGPFVHAAATPYRGHRKVIANTARGGPKAGKWTQPDLTLIAIQRLSIQKRIELELFSFELKRQNDSDVDSVFEAVAHTRYAHYAYLAWHQPSLDIVAKEKQRDVESNCRTHGIGLILFSEPLLPATYLVLLAPARKTPHPYDVEEYLERRLKEPDLEAVKRNVLELEASWS